MFLLIEDGSMSIWIFLRARRERIDPAGDTVVEPRARRHSMTSQSCMAMFAS